MFRLKTKSKRIKSLTCPDCNTTIEYTFEKSLVAFNTQLRPGVLNVISPTLELLSECTGCTTVLGEALYRELRNEDGICD